MQVHTKDMRDQEELSPNDMGYRNPSQLDFPKKIRKVMLWEYHASSFFSYCTQHITHFI